MARSLTQPMTPTTRLTVVAVAARYVDHQYDNRCETCTVGNDYRRKNNNDILFGGHRSSKATFTSIISTPDLQREFTENKTWDSQGKEVHAHMVKTGIEQNTYAGTKLLAMYAKCGDLSNACQVFDKLHKPSLFSWTAMIMGYIRHGYNEEGLTLYYRMQRASIWLDTFIFPGVLKACAALQALRPGEEIHAHIIRSGFESDVFTASALVDMYAKCGKIECARQLFNSMPQRSVVSWNATIAGYAQNGHGNEALKLFWQMQQEGIKPTSVTLVIVLPACANLGALQQGREIHTYVIRNGYDSGVFVGSALVDMYIKSGNIENARQVFDKMSERNVVSWNAMIAGYAQMGCTDEALKLFRQMQLEGVKPDLITWTAMIAGYGQNGNCNEALKLFYQMQSSGIKPNVISWTAIITGCSQNGHCDEALKHFRQMQLAGIKPDVISWNAIIAGYAQNEHWDEALRFFRQMQITGLTPNSVTIASVLPACASLAALQQGKEIHDYIIRRGFESDVFVGSALLDMYAKCGTIEGARNVFDKMSQKRLAIWNAMIAGYAMHGHGKHALRLFYQMQQGGVNPDHITFTGLLSACSHAGLVEEGRQYFERMSQDYHIIPTKEHYACMVDLLGRAGFLDEAHDLVSKMPIEADACVWGALLGACRIHCNVDLGECVAEHLFELEPENTGGYVLLSNIHAAAGRWDDVAKVRKMMKYKRLLKSPGCSWIEIKNKVHVFLVGDTSHPQIEKIYATLECLTRQLKVAGYIPDTNFVLHDLEE